MPEVPQQEVATLQSVCEEPAASDEDRRESGEDLGLASPGETPLGVSSLSHNVSEGSIIPGSLMTPLNHGLLARSHDQLALEMLALGF